MGNQVRGEAIVRDGDLDLPDRINYAISPDGQHSVFSARGDLFIVPTGKGQSSNVTRSPAAEEDSQVGPRTAAGLPTSLKLQAHLKWQSVLSTMDRSAC